MDTFEIPEPAAPTPPAPAKSRPPSKSRAKAGDGTGKAQQSRSRPSSSSKPSGASKAAGTSKAAGGNKPAAAPKPAANAKPANAAPAARKPPVAPAARSAPAGSKILVGRKLLGRGVQVPGNKAVAGARKPGANLPRQQKQEHAAEEVPKDNYRGIFSKELPVIMFGYGDSERPLPETVDLVEDILVDYISELTRKAMDLCLAGAKISVEDIMFLYRKDSRKYSRIKELLRANEELKRARMSFKEDAEEAAQAADEE